MSYCKQEFSGFTKFEYCWLIFAVLTIFSISIVNNYTLLEIITGVTGVLSCILCGQGKISSYVFGTITCLGYSYLSFHAHYYGEVLLNILYYIPSNIYGFYYWYKYMRTYEISNTLESIEVDKKNFNTVKEYAITIGSIIGGTIILGLFLKYIGGYNPGPDAFTSVASIVAQVLMVLRYTEQWLLWIIIDAVTVWMWYMAYITTGANFLMVIMWCLYLTNAVIMYLRWKRLEGK